jgi:hypothetical protein
MALDFFISRADAPVYSLDESNLKLVAPVLDAYRNRTGLNIDQYSDGSLQPEHMRLLLEVIGRYQNEADLNRDRGQTAVIFRLAGLLDLCLRQRLTLYFRGD